MAAEACGWSLAVLRKFGELDTVIGEHDMDAIWNGIDECFEERCRSSHICLLDELDHSELRGTVDGYEQVELAFGGPYLGQTDVEEADRIGIVRIKIEAFALDSTSIKAHPDGTGAQKKGPQAIGKSRAGWNTKVHLVAANARTAITFALSPGNAHDAPEGRALLAELGSMPEGLPMLMDRAYEGDETRQLVLSLGMIPVVPPKSNRIEPWEYDRALYKKRNEIELPQNLLSLRETRCPLPRLPHLHPHRRSPALV